MNRAVVLAWLFSSAIIFSVSAQEKPIIMDFVDGDSGCPIEGYKVDIMKGYIGNIVDLEGSIKTIGVSDANGHVEGTVPLSLAGYGTHGIHVNGFLLLISHDIYGDRLYTFGADDGAPYKSSVIRLLPFIYDMRVLTDETKSFIEIQYRSRKGTTLGYDDPGAERYSGDRIYKYVNGTNRTLVFSKDDIDVDELITFRDNNTGWNNTYHYEIYESLLHNVEVTFTMNRHSPELTTIVPAPSSRPCSSSLYADFLNFGKVLLGESATMDIVVHGIKDEIELSGLELPDAFSSDFQGAILSNGSNLKIPVTFTPTEIKDYDNKIGLVSNGVVISQAAIAARGTDSVDDGFISSPNPYDKNLTVTIPVPGPATISICSSLGQVLFETSGESVTTYTLDLGNLPPGLQILRVRSGGQTYGRLIYKK